MFVRLMWTGLCLLDQVGEMDDVLGVFCLGDSSEHGGEMGHDLRVVDGHVVIDDCEDIGDGDGDGKQSCEHLNQLKLYY
jgi:hypothetical protein